MRRHHTTFDPDVVVFRGNARQIMLLSEAARAAGVFEEATTMGRPACAILPLDVIVSTKEELETFHRQRAATL